MGIHLGGTVGGNRNHRHLIALLLPAIQAAREAARRMECQNHLKQMTLGILNHESSMHFFPTGGWGWGWIGDPDLGFGNRQPGGWVFNILPYMEMKSTYNMGKGLTGATKVTALQSMAETPISLFNCPTRRPAILYPWTLGAQNGSQFGTPRGAGRSDYAINAGNTDCQYNYGGPPWPDLSALNGICYQRSAVTLKQITNGTSHTYLVGEKYLSPDSYKTGSTWDDNECLYSGYDDDNYRSGYNQPYRDRSGYGGPGCSFGSAHSVVWNAAFCDGSVHPISYDIDPLIHAYQSNRRNKVPF